VGGKTGKIRGVATIANLEYLKRKGIADKFLADLNVGLREALLNLKPSEWYPYEEIDAPFMRAVNDLVAKGNMQFFVDMGKFDADYNSKWYLKLFFKFITPAKMVKKFPTLWDINFDSGKMEVVRLHRDSATVRLTGFNTTRFTDYALIGWGEYALEKSEAKNVKIVLTKCREKGDKYSEWHVS
jgi:hypothetical protein